MANIVRRAEHWRRFSTAPTTLASYEEPGWEFRELEYGPGGSWDFVTTKLHIASHLDAVRQRIGSSSAPFLNVPPSTAVSSPGDCVAGSWEGRGKSQHILISTGFIAATLGRDISANLVERRPFARTREPDHRDEITMKLMQTLRIEIITGNTHGPLFKQAIVAALIHQALHALPIIREQSSTSGLSFRQLGLVFDLMDSQMHGRPSLNDFGALLGVSVQYFCRAFKLSTGLSPHQHMMRRRVEFARAMIETGNLPLSDVAQASGFADQSQMAATFKRILDVSPSYFRLN